MSVTGRNVALFLRELAALAANEPLFVSAPDTVGCRLLISAPTAAPVPAAAVAGGLALPPFPSGKRGTGGGKGRGCRRGEFRKEGRRNRPRPLRGGGETPHGGLARRPPPRPRRAPAAAGPARTGRAARGRRPGGPGEQPRTPQRPRLAATRPGPRLPTTATGGSAAPPPEPRACPQGPATDGQREAETDGSGPKGGPQRRRPAYAGAGGQGGGAGAARAAAHFGRRSGQNCAIKGGGPLSSRS